MTRTPSFGVVAALAALSLSPAACQPSPDQAREGQDTSPVVADDRDAPVPEAYVPTPYGWFHPSCVVHLGAGERLAEGAQVEGPGGARRALPTCAFPSFARGRRKPGASVELAQAARANGAPREPAIDHDWIMASNDSGHTSASFLSASWSVPQAPRHKAEQTVFYFPGLVNTTGANETILQPVLGWNAGFDIPGWSIASWNCCQKGTVTNSDAAAVNDGDTIYGEMAGSACHSGVCDNWDVTTTDTTTGKSVALSTTFFGNKADSLYAGALEVYLLDDCAEYPASGSVSFYDVVVRDTQGATVHPAWQPVSWPNDPSCGATVRSGGSVVSLSWHSTVWSTRPGAASDIAIGADGSVWMTAPTGGIYRWSGIGWVGHSGTGVRVAVDAGGRPWVVDAQNSIWRLAGPLWQHLPGSATDLAAGADGSVWAVGTAGVAGDGPVSKWDESAHAWATVGAATATHLAIDPQGNPWLVDHAGHVSRRVGASFVPVVGTMRDIAIGANGRVWGLGFGGTDADPYRWDGHEWLRYTEGSGNALAVDPKGQPWMVDSAHHVYQLTD